MLGNAKWRVVEYVRRVYITVDLWLARRKKKGEVAEDETF